MTLATFRYPGDPDLPVQLLTGREFLASQPKPREVVFYGNDVQRFDLGDQIICDQCNADVKPDDACALVDASRLYCATCMARWITPYLVGGVR